MKILPNRLPFRVGSIYCFPDDINKGIDYYFEVMEIGIINYKIKYLHNGEIATMDKERLKECLNKGERSLVKY